MSRIAFFVYGLVSYVVFLAAFLYAIGFVGSMLVPKGINDGAEGPMGTAILINVALLGLFGVQHSIMARPGFKSWWTKIMPVQIERSTFVLLASLILGLMYWQWRPIPESVWHVSAEWARYLLIGISLAGWALVLYSTFLIDHFDLFGLRQVWLHLQQKEYTHPPFMERSVYKLVRHPLMLGFIIAFWFTPDMTQGHLLFAIVTTAYILVALQLEERDLLSILGDDYRSYRRRTRMLMPLPKGGSAGGSKAGSATGSGGE
jgi:protein-S-isoprenylcysteine O-methyltransferase Ste14